MTSHRVLKVEVLIKRIINGIFQSLLTLIFNVTPLHNSKTNRKDITLQKISRKEYFSNFYSLPIQVI